MHRNGSTGLARMVGRDIPALQLYCGEYWSIARSLFRGGTRCRDYRSDLDLLCWIRSNFTSK